MKKNDNFLDYIPAISDKISWTEDSDIVTIHVTHRGIFPWLVQKFFSKPKISHIKLDDYGSYVWLNINGRNTIFDLGKLLQEKYGDKMNPLYERLVHYLRILKNNDFILYDKEHLK